MPEETSLTHNQSELLRAFFSLPPKRVVFSKRERKELWKFFKSHREIPGDYQLDVVCPALHLELVKALESGNNVQSAVMSECVYAQALADMFQLTDFGPAETASRWLDGPTQDLLQAHGMVARYAYRSGTGSRVLIQAGGHGGVDGALISVEDERIFTIEFKEPAAKASEPDLPPYGEDGHLVITEAWAKRNPHFIPMVNEQIDQKLNFFDVAGSNINSFSPTSVQVAVSQNYSGEKFADVICTEDVDAMLTVIPADQAAVWADIRGEIRPSGRNHYEVYTPDRLAATVMAMGGTVHDSVVTVSADALTATPPRGGEGISRFKIDPFFFVRAGDVTLGGGVATFTMKSVRQLRPTISAHMFFRKLKVGEVREFYVGGG